MDSLDQIKFDIERFGDMAPAWRFCCDRGNFVAWSASPVLFTFEGIRHTRTICPIRGRVKIEPRAKKSTGTTILWGVVDAQEPLHKNYIGRPAWVIPWRDGDTSFIYQFGTIKKIERVYRHEQA